MDHVQMINVRLYSIFFFFELNEKKKLIGLKNLLFCFVLFHFFTSLYIFAVLQYYGFVEKDNVHDVYVMPPLREWDISAMENACGRSFSSGRLQKLERAGLLGFSSNSNKNESVANRAGGVVLTRAGGIDPAVLQALRALVSSDEEWQDAGEAVGNFASEKAGGDANEYAMKSAAKAALQMELNNKETTMEEDEKLLQTAKSVNLKSSMSLSEQEVLAVQFRLEKKKLLKEIIDSL